METKGPEIHKRKTWDEYFIGIMDAVSERATCDRGMSGCVIVRDKHILSTGYVGSPRGMPHCDEAGHLFRTVRHEDGSQTKHCVRTTHAEQNAICQAARLGIAIDGGTMYCKMEPCYTCAKMIVNAGIKRVVAKKKYHDAADTRELFRCAGVELVVLEDSVEEYAEV